MVDGSLEATQLNHGVEIVYLYQNSLFIDESKSDDKAFIFTLKNPHEVEPTRYRKIKDSDLAILCNSNFGPVFGNCEVFISTFCIERDSCWVQNGSCSEYEYHPDYQMSLFVNTNEPTISNAFTVLDYEVYCIENYKDYVYNTCKYPDIIWEYIETNTISKESLQKLNDDTELFNEFDSLHFFDLDYRLNVSNYFLKHPSHYLQNTRIVGCEYDDILSDWLGSESEWKLAFRASDHHYRAIYFHKYCDDKGPTLIVIKSSGGWIFGGYTTQSWSGDCIEWDMSI